MPSTIREEELLIDKDEISLLEAQGLLSAPHNGIRAISSSIIFPWSSSSSENPPISTDHMVEIPEYLISEASLRFMGLSEEGSATIWRHWLRLGENWPFDFISEVRKWLRYYPDDAEGYEDDWDGVMMGMGVGRPLIEAILAPEYSDIRTTASAKYWVLDSISIAWSSLEAIQHASSIRAQKLRQSTDPTTQVSVPPSTPDLREGLLPPSTLKSEQAPDTTILYKGINIEKAKGINIVTGDNHISSLATYPPTDFVGYPAAIFSFNLDLNVAEKYCAYARKRHTLQPTCIVQMAVPNSLFEQLNPVIIKFGNDWKQLVWHSRAQKALAKEIKHLERRPLYIGDICQSHCQSITRLSSWEDMTEDNLMYTEEEVEDPSTKEEVLIKKAATQYVWRGDDIQETLEQQCTFNIVRSQ